MRAVIRLGIRGSGVEYITGLTQRDRHTLSFPPTANLESPISLTCMSVDGGRKPEGPEGTHTGSRRICKRHTDKILIVVLQLLCVCINQENEGGKNDDDWRVYCEYVCSQKKPSLAVKLHQVDKWLCPWHCLSYFSTVDVENLAIITT